MRSFIPFEQAIVLNLYKREFGMRLDLEPQQVLNKLLEPEFAHQICNKIGGRA